MSSLNYLRYKIVIAYDGTHYCGWQTQSNGPSIEAVLEKALVTILRHPIFVCGSGRTDSGVHARGQVAHFDSNAVVNPEKTLFSLNGLLPSDIRVLSLELAEGNFHARYSVKQKTYQYHLHLDPVTDPILFPFRHHLKGTIDKKKLIEGTKLFLGTHDFTSFANNALGNCAAHDSIRTLSRFEPIEQPGGLILELTSDGFLYKMVRNLVGTLIDLSRGKFEPSDIPKIFEAKNRSRAGIAVPSNGLFLMRVDY
jgi:tRNA pseudouridine38-40 synthase